MSSYIVPSVLFQTQQKLKKSEQQRKKHKKKKRDKKASEKSSTPTGSIASVKEEPIGSDSPTASQSPLNPKELSTNLERLKRSQSSDSLSSNIANKFISADHTGTNTASVSGEQTPISGDYLEPAESLQPPGVDSIQQSELRRNSASTTSSFRQKYRRNSSFSSSHTSSSLPFREKKNLASPLNTAPHLNANTTHSTLTPQASSSQLSAVSQTSTPPTNLRFDTESDASSRIFKPSYSMAQVDDFPEFNTIRDLGLLNTMSRMQETLFSPTFQIFKFNNFLDILSAQHSNDPINFANTRYNSISRFIVRHSLSSNTHLENEWKANDMRDFEGPLAYQLITMRSFLRKLIRIQSTRESSRSEIFSCEELVQINFTNYMRFLLNLPQKYLSTPSEQIDKVLAMHQKFKVMFTKLIKSLHDFSNEESGEVPSIQNSTSLLLQIITKVSYEYILLEKYHINILVKLGGNSLIDTLILSRLFDDYKTSSIMPPEKRDPPRILVYNSYFSSQYSWYLSVTIPFLTVVELNVFHEDPNEICDFEKYKKHEKSVPKHNFTESDESLYNDYFKDIRFKDFADYRSKTDEELVKLHRPTYERKSVNSDSSTSSTQHKPKNFSYYTGSLATVPDNSFDVIQSRDLLFQLTNTNMKTLVAEFHRVLKVGGVLDVPILLLGSDTIGPDKRVVGLPRFTDTTGLDLSQYYDMIPNFAEVFLQTIVQFFGDGNVKIATILLDSSNEVFRFLVSDIMLHIAEMIGQTDQYSKMFALKLDKDDSKDIHFFFQIRATKS